MYFGFPTCTPTVIRVFADTSIAFECKWGTVSPWHCLYFPHRLLGLFSTCTFKQLFPIHPQLQCLWSILSLAVDFNLLTQIYEKCGWSLKIHSVCSVVCLVLACVKHIMQILFLENWKIYHVIRLGDFFYTPHTHTLLCTANIPCLLLNRARFSSFCVFWTKIIYWKEEGQLVSCGG